MYSCLAAKPRSGFEVWRRASKRVKVVAAMFFLFCMTWVVQGCGVKRGKPGKSRSGAREVKEAQKIISAEERLFPRSRPWLAEVAGLRLLPADTAMVLVFRSPDAVGKVLGIEEAWKRFPDRRKALSSEWKEHLGIDWASPGVMERLGLRADQPIGLFWLKEGTEGVFASTVDVKALKKVFSRIAGTRRLLEEKLSGGAILVKPSWEEQSRFLLRLVLKDGLAVLLYGGPRLDEQARRLGRAFSIASPAAGRATSAGKGGAGKGRRAADKPLVVQVDASGSLAENPALRSSHETLGFGQLAAGFVNMRYLVAARLKEMEEEIRAREETLARGSKDPAAKERRDASMNDFISRLVLEDTRAARRFFAGLGAPIQGIAFGVEPVAGLLRLRAFVSLDAPAARALEHGPLAFSTTSAGSALPCPESWHSMPRMAVNVKAAKGPFIVLLAHVLGFEERTIRQGLSWVEEQLGKVAAGKDLVGRDGAGLVVLLTGRAVMSWKREYGNGLPIPTPEMVLELKDEARAARLFSSVVDLLRARHKAAGLKLDMTGDGAGFFVHGFPGLRSGVHVQRVGRLLFVARQGRSSSKTEVLKEAPASDKADPDLASLPMGLAGLWLPQKLTSRFGGPWWLGLLPLRHRSMRSSLSMWMFASMHPGDGELKRLHGRLGELDKTKTGLEEKYQDKLDRWVGQWQLFARPAQGGVYLSGGLDMPDGGVNALVAHVVQQWPLTGKESRLGRQIRKIEAKIRARESSLIRVAITKSLGKEMDDALQRGLKSMHSIGNASGIGGLGTGGTKGAGGGAGRGIGGFGSYGSSRGTGGFGSGSGGRRGTAKPKKKK